MGVKVFIGRGDTTYTPPQPPSGRHKAQTPVELLRCRGTGGIWGAPKGSWLGPPHHPRTSLGYGGVQPRAGT